MAHDTHFLERLSRVNLAQTERALALYRDPELVRAVLARAGVGERAERVAIALEEGPDSPHLIVDRAGHFITCLGAGMAVADLPVVSRAQLDGVVARQRAMREMLDTLQDQTRGSLKRLFQPLRETASQISDEEIRPLLALAPLLAEDFEIEAGTLSVHVSDHVTHLAASRASPAALREGLEHLWNAHWAVGHYALLAGAGVPHLTEAAAERLLKDQEHLLIGLMLHGSLVPQTTRVLWATVQLGRPFLPCLKRLFTEAQVLLMPPVYGAALTAVALGHSKLRAEVIKTLERTPTLAGAPPLAQENFRRFLDHLRQDWMPVLDDPDGAVSRLQTSLRALGGWEGSERAAAEQIIPYVLNLPLQAFAVSGNHYHVLIQSLPWLARARAEELYLPAELAHRPEFGFTLARGQALLAALTEPERNPRSSPMQAEDRPGRNEVCPCGSGKKYKRCCGGNELPQ